MLMCTEPAHDSHIEPVALRILIRPAYAKPLERGFAYSFTVEHIVCLL
jgi:hypothetical protein